MNIHIKHIHTTNGNEIKHKRKKNKHELKKRMKINRINKTIKIIK